MKPLKSRGLVLCAVLLETAWSLPARAELSAEELAKLFVPQIGGAVP
jgi:hypothetical protein